MRNIKFVSYDGKYPNLCSGVLILNVDGKIVTINKYSLCSGGSAHFNDDYSESFIEYGPWSLNEGHFSDYSEEEKEYIIELINENIPHGCCGGCL